MATDTLPETATPAWRGRVRSCTPEAAAFARECGLDGAVGVSAGIILDLFPGRAIDVELDQDPEDGSRPVRMRVSGAAPEPGTSIPLRRQYHADWVALAPAAQRYRVVPYFAMD